LTQELSVIFILKQNFCGIIIKPPVHDVYTAMFAEQPSFHSLDTCEDTWNHTLDANINIQRNW